MTRAVRGALANRSLVLLAVALLTVWGAWALRHTSVDVLPDLSDVQVIIRTSFPGQAPQIVEDQVTYPLASALLAVPGARTVRGYSFFGDSFVYVLFEDGTDPYWARSRVLEYLRQAESLLPAGAESSLGPDATGVGWIYEYALVDRTGRHDLSQLRALQDWWLRFELQSLEGVAEVATIGGMVREYQVLLDPLRLLAQRITVADVRQAIERANRETGGSVVELAEAEYMVRAGGYVSSVEDLKNTLVKDVPGSTPVLLSDVAHVRVGPQMRRGLADLDGQGEVVGGLIVMRYGADTRATIAGVRERLDTLRKSLPAGVEIVTTYDRSDLIDRSISTLARKLTEEFVIVLLVCLAFLLRLRSALVVVVVLPAGILASLIIMQVQGVSANIMSLAGIAIAIGVMVDAAIVMVENVHKRLETAANGTALTSATRTEIVADACAEVGPALFYSLLIIAASFLPVLALQAEEGRLFAPLAYTKTYAVLAAALLSVTLVPVLIWWLVREPLRREQDNPINRLTARAYQPLLAFALHRPWAVILGALALVLITAVPAARLGAEFMPQMDEGDLLYMPTTQPGISIDAVRAVLQQTDRALREVPEVERVFGKAGRAETATDPAPLEMLETIVKLKPRDEWRPGMTPRELIRELDSRVQFPGLTNAWLPPIRGRVDMLTTGSRSPLALKISGPELQEIEQLAVRAEHLLKRLPGTASAYAERVSGGRYVDVSIDRPKASSFGLSVNDLHEVIAFAVGGGVVGESVQGRERYPISVRYGQDWRDSLESLRRLPIVTRQGTQIALGDVADVSIVEGSAMIRSENARPATWVYITPSDGDLRGYVRAAQQLLDTELSLPTGYTMTWTGQYEHLDRAFTRLGMLTTMAVALIVLMLYLCFRSARDVLLIMGSLPVALIGGIWLLWALDFRMSVAVAVGFIALAGVAAETGVVMLLYLNNAWNARCQQGSSLTRQDLLDAIREGALLRLRPKLMTVAAIIGGLLPMMLGTATGSEVMRRIAAPMLGGMLSATLLTLVVIPALFLLVHKRSLESVPQSER